MPERGYIEDITCPNVGTNRGYYMRILSSSAQVDIDLFRSDLLFNYGYGTVQFEAEGYGQNEIISHIDRSEIKL